VSDWALNVVAHQHGGEVAALIDAAADLRRVQAGAIEGRGGDLRSALNGMRAAATAVQRRADEVLTAAGRDRGAQVAAITSRLSEVAANEAVAEQLRAGRLGTAPVEAADPFAGLEPAAVPPRPAKKPKATKRVEPVEAPPPPRPDPAVRRRLEKAAADARRAVDAAEAALAKAQADLERAEESLARFLEHGR